MAPPFPLPLRELVLICLLTILAGCASTPKPVPARPATTSPLLNYALSLQGAPYRWGKGTPGEGFDCSGFVQHVYGRYGIRLPRTALQMASVLPQVDNRYRQPGDLVFFNTTGQPFSHVGIYLGNDAFVHASGSLGRVAVSRMDGPYWWEHFLGIRRPYHR